MKPQHWLLLTRLALATILAASSALYLHYLDPADSGFCGLRSACEAVRRSGFSHLGVRWLSLPLLSLLAYGGLFAFSVKPQLLSRGPLSRWNLARTPYLLLFAATGLGAVVALGLIALQAFWIRQYCWLCLTVDSAAIAAAGCAFGLARAHPGQAPLPEPLRAGPWFAIAGLCLAGPVGWSVLKPARDVPASILALYQPDKLNVVEFADFQCPYCRRLHATLSPVLQSYGDRVHFQRLHRPLEQHPMAEAAARAAICADEQDKGEAMADALFSMQLGPADLTRAAERLALDPDRYDACLQAASTDAVLNDHEALLPAEHFDGLPTTYIGHQKVLGVRSEVELRDLFRKAEKGPGPSMSGPVFVGLWLFALGLVYVAGLARKDPAENESLTSS